MQHAQAGRAHLDVSDNLMLARELEVAERIRDKSGMFTIRQVASIHKMSIPFLREFAERHGITFVGTDGSRTKRISSAVIARERRHTSTVVARSLTRKPVTSLDSDKLTPELRERARRRDQESVNGFIEHLRDLSQTHTREEAAKKVGISPTFMRRLAYDQELVFVGEVAPATQCASPSAIKKLQSTLFRPSKKMKPTTSRLIRNFVISDVQDEL